MKKILATTLFIASTCLNAQVASEPKSSREIAKKLYISLTGTQPNSSELNYLQTKISNDQYVDAGMDIIDQKGGIQNGGAFYGVTIKDWVTPKFNKQRTTLAPLNDGAATIIGYIRDERPFNKILYENSVD